jgi:hypothetical protein
MTTRQPVRRSSHLQRNGLAPARGGALIGEQAGRDHDAGRARRERGCGVNNRRRLTNVVARQWLAEDQDATRLSRGRESCGACRGHFAPGSCPFGRRLSGRRAFGGTLRESRTDLANPHPHPLGTTPGRFGLDPVSATGNADDRRRSRPCP